jgi:hypothetical protein
MPIFVLFLFRFARLLFSGHAAVAVENVALRLQLTAFQQKRKRPVLTSFDRLFWVGLSMLWNRWHTPLVYVRTDTYFNISFSVFRHLPAEPPPSRAQKFRNAAILGARVIDFRTNGSTFAGPMSLRRWPH